MVKSCCSISLENSPLELAELEELLQDSAADDDDDNDDDAEEEACTIAGSIGVARGIESAKSLGNGGTFNPSVSLPFLYRE